MTYPDSEIVTTHYNNNMLPTDVSGTSNYVPSMTYDIAGRLLTRALGNGLTQNYKYYPWNQQGGRLHTLVTGSLQNLTYQYDSVGNITQIADSLAGETSVYDYDALDRLTSWQLNQNSPETYTYDAQGNLDVKNGLDLNYNDAAHKHAVTSVSNQSSVNSYQYDQNGNQTVRHIGNDTFDLAYDAENRLVEVKKNDVTISQFSYDGDGKRVMSVMDGETIRFVGGYYERKGSQITKYYMAGAARAAMRKYTIPQNMTVEYMVGDHLGSTSITTDTNGALISEMRYKPWGEVRHVSGLSPTDYTYTGQYSYMDDPTTAASEGFGLMFYNARWYDPGLGRFTQADTIVPLQSQGVQAWDRYAYVRNNPIRYTDPSGHDVCDEDGNCYDNNTWHRAPGAPRLSTIDTWKKMIRSKFGVKMKDDKIAWGAANLQTAYRALNAINNVLNGCLRNLVGGATFILTDGGHKYYGAAHHDGSGVTFHVADSTVEIPMINFLHETAHVLDSRPATKDVFSGSLPNNPSWVVNGFVNEDILLGKIAQPVQSKYIRDKNGKQTEAYSPNEYWADAFANYVAGNINLERSAGAALATDVANALNPYINP